MENVLSFTGGITNSNSMSGLSAGIAIVGVTTFSGAISNAGTIAAKTGININHSTITGAIIDSGVVLGSSFGIRIDSASQITASTGDAIAVTGSTFTGGISSAGTISAGAAGIYLSQQITTFLGNVVNSGTISALTGVYVGRIATFSGNVSNAGQILAGTGNGIVLAGVETFTGGVVNSGTISAGIGIQIAGGTIHGAIVDSGIIVGSQWGMTLAAGATIAGATTTIKITGPTFAGPEHRQPREHHYGDGRA